MSAVNLSQPPTLHGQSVAQSQGFLSQPSTVLDVNETRNANPNGVQPDEGTPGYVPRPKRIACMVCRRRKLRCDGKKPTCANCARLGHECAYNEVRKKSGPKRGYVKQLEARLAQVETLLKGQDAVDKPQNPAPVQESPFQVPLQNARLNDIPDLPIGPTSMEEEPAMPLPAFADLPSNSAGLAEPSLAMGADISWEMIGLGLEEALPPQEVIDELYVRVNLNSFPNLITQSFRNEIYFQKIHPSSAMIHKPRYYAAMSLTPSMRPPVCLRYIMWAHAAAATERYQSLHSHFYQRARKYIELDEMKGLGESLISVAHAQCWVLISSYEFKMMYFPRAWMSTGRATRLSLMMGLHRQDGLGLDVKQCIPPARDWTEREERRRTFWVAFCQDRYASVGTGWPMMVDERDILTYLPASDEAFVSCRAQKSMSLADAISGQSASTLSSFAGIVVLTCLLGRNLHHLHRPSANDKPHDLNGDFWKRHRALDNILLNTSLSLPSHLRLPEGLNDPNTVFCNMCIHTSTICLHQAAIFKADKNDMPNQIAAESKRRCIVAADQITNMMKMISHVDLTLMNPFLAFCLYVAARVFVQYLKSRSEDLSVRSSLQFLISAMNALKNKNPLSQSFLVQLEFDLENSDLDVPAVVCSSMPCSLQSGSESVCYEPHDEIALKDRSLTFALRNDQVQDDPNHLSHSTPSNDNATGKRAQQPDGHSNSRSGFPPNTSLPTRQKPTIKHQKQQQPAHSTHYRPPTVIQNSGDMADISFSTVADQQMRAFVMEMDISTDMSVSSDRQPSGSDHSTPATHHTSSNSSVSPHNVDHPSPPKQPQQPSQSHVFLSTPSPNLETNSMPNSFTPFPLVSDPTTSNPFSFPASWHYSQRQQSQSQAQIHSQSQGGNAIPTTTDITSNTTEGIDIMPFDDLQWMQNETSNVLDWRGWQG
ncbi:hypothetical protein PRK78_007050 [Emydomyces testavorans]|uniref:Zn(2)-C6 fungal-type domain-containing protein n=1 Tax=Emydomyces testavorans TaxID=2070801 RepID=A0AAF0IPV0_9EURO|nr:hypothetical protein PRK78_007050 [Emydomyces testavorans]